MSAASRDLYSEAEVVELLAQVLSAVDYLHSRRVVHLDLKSDNMLVDDGGHLKIVDFGSAQSFTPGQPLNVEHLHGPSDSKGNGQLPVPRPQSRSLTFSLTISLSWLPTDCRSKGTRGIDECAEPSANKHVFLSLLYHEFLFLVTDTSACE